MGTFQVQEFIIEDITKGLVVKKMDIGEINVLHCKPYLL